MTYVDWSAGSRDASTTEDFANVEARFLANPEIRENVHFGRFRGQRVLDIGCGSGVAACLFAKHGADVMAVDLTSAATQMARLNAALSALPINFAQMDAEQLALPSNAYDHVFSWGVIHHSRNTEQIVREIQRVLRPGGTGLIMVYHRHSIRYFVRGLYWLLVKRKALEGYTLPTVQALFTDGYYQRHFTARELRAVLARAGLATTRTSVSHMTDRYSARVPLPLDRWLQRNFGWLLTIEFEKRACEMTAAPSAGTQSEETHE